MNATLNGHERRLLVVEKGDAGECHQYLRRYGYRVTTSTPEAVAGAIHDRIPVAVGELDLEQPGELETLHRLRKSSPSTPSPMLLKQPTLRGIAEGKISLAFRRWKRPTVRSGGQLRTAIGVLAIDSVDVVREKDISLRDARRAGFGSRQELLQELRSRGSGPIYRIKLRYEGEDPRRQLRKKSRLSRDELADVTGKLERMDSASRQGPWTLSTLQLIAANPGVRAGDLADSVAQETLKFKRRVRKLKDLGLTESLEVGYRLSPRGQAVLKQLDR